MNPLEWPEYNTLKDPELFKRQAAFVRKVIGEINHYDNIYYEICNEPGGGVKGFAPPSDVDAWQTAVAKVVREEMSNGPSVTLFSGVRLSAIPLSSTRGPTPVSRTRTSML